MLPVVLLFLYLLVAAVLIGVQHRADVPAPALVLVSLLWPATAFLSVLVLIVVVALDLPPRSPKR
jgi:hypothetical protein